MPETCDTMEMLAAHPAAVEQPNKDRRFFLGPATVDTFAVGTG